MRYLLWQRNYHIVCFHNLKVFSTLALFQLSLPHLSGSDCFFDRLELEVFLAVTASSYCSCGPLVPLQLHVDDWDNSVRVLTQGVTHRGQLTFQIFHLSENNRHKKICLYCDTGLWWVWNRILHQPSPILFYATEHNALLESISVYLVVLNLNFAPCFPLIVSRYAADRMSVISGCWIHLVCVYVCVYLCMYVCIYVCICVCNASIHVCMYVFTYVCIALYILMNACMYVCMYVSQ